MRTKKRSIKLLGYMGFLGFLGFDYFLDKNVGTLFMFSYFSYFPYFILAKLLTETPDERFFENSSKARLKVMPIPMAALFVVGFCSSFAFATKEFVVIISSIGWTMTIMAYAFLLYRYETH